MSKKPQYARRLTRPVFVGQVGIGGLNPIRIQSMTTTDTMDTIALVREIKQLADAGCEIVRLTVPNQQDCDNLVNVRREMASQRIKVPLVADIHFTPTVAMKVVDFVEKVRINPGNFADKKLFKTFEIKDEDYQSELLRIEEKFAPLVEKCKDRGVAMRIGTNHGSLSDRIMNRYGDTPQGMVESALEFLRIAARLNYHDIVLSMKASNPQVMVTAYRQLVKRMNEEGFDYPLHLGVTEAGEGEDARIKSAVGIGTLLEEGIGDTIRVSLTEDSVYEIPVAGGIVAPYNHAFYDWNFKGQPALDPILKKQDDAFALSYSRRPSVETKIKDVSLGASKTVTVWADAKHHTLEDVVAATQGDMRFEGVECDASIGPATIARAQAQNLLCAIAGDSAAQLVPFAAADLLALNVKGRSQWGEVAELLAATPNHVQVRLQNCSGWFSDAAFVDTLKRFKSSLPANSNSRLSFALSGNNSLARDGKLLAYALEQADWHVPLQLIYQAGERPVQLDAATQIGALLVDGIGDAVQISGELPLSESLTISYGILQAARVRISKTEFIACPSCGRTQFHLQDVTAKIKARTSHLKGLKIAIMGCIVNGPGEMADADFGYVGTGAGKISLYVGKECVQRNLPEASALDSLVDLIKEHGKWVDG